MLTTIYPPKPSDLTKFDEKYLLFLAGPIQGAPDWQTKAIELLSPLNELSWDIVVANPRAPGKWHEQYNEQVDWEVNHLYKADAVLFWLANQTEETPGRHYAQTTRFELGEAFARYNLEPYPPLLFLGIEPGFTNERYIRRRFVTSDVLDDADIASSLEDLCASFVDNFTRWYEHYSQDE